MIDYVNKNLSNPISLDELAAIAYFSPFHFHRVFVAVTGETVNNFTSRLRNEKAARLLKFSGQPIAAIAAECGFSSSAALSRNFQQYFGVSPRAYRNGGEMKNSKICKELYDGSRYHCNNSQADLANIFPVTVKQLPERRIAYIRVFDAFREGLVLSAFSELVEWAKKMNLFETETIFGMSIDDPDVTPKEKYRYEVCITIPQQMSLEPGSFIEISTLPPCKYATTRVSGDFNLVVSGTNYLFDTWLINSEYECEAQHVLEVFLDKPNICNWDHFELELCVPVKALLQ